MWHSQVTTFPPLNSGGVKSILTLILYQLLPYCRFRSLIVFALFASRCRCWCLGFGTSSSKLSVSASRPCRCIFVVGNGVPSCGCVCWLLLLAVVGSIISGGITFLSLAVVSSWLGLLSLEASCCRRRWQLVIVRDGLTLLAEAAASATAALRCSLNSLV